MHFTKYHGLGNDFIFIDTKDVNKYDFSQISAQLCDRHFGIGADGVVTLKHISGIDFKMRIYNSDGTECEMCGNATRCAAKYIHTNQLAEGSSYNLHTLAGIIRPTLNSDNTVTVNMGEPILHLPAIPVTYENSDSNVNLKIALKSGEKFQITAVSMGNPHAVIFVDDINQVPLTSWGPEIETNAIFPRKTNVEFVQVLNPHEVRMRVWERGCGVTMACGTGSCATAVAAVLNHLTDRKIKVILDGGILTINWAEDNNVYMTGSATEVFSGQYKF
ncbi:MAG: diaminopimelate epimerase [Lentisphaeria bacterium]